MYINLKGFSYVTKQVLPVLQIISPVDKGIAQCIEENLAPWPASWEIDNIQSNPLLKDPYDDVHTKYQEDVKQLCYFR